MISVKGLSITLNNHQVLNNINLKLEAGKILGMIGPNGAGKSTLIHAICGLHPVQSGCVKISGRDINELSDNERALLIAVVPQVITIPTSITAREMVLLGRTPHINWLGHLSNYDQEKAHQAMYRTDTLDLANRQIDELSGGEQQRVFLARTLAQATPILLMDEPTAHLDLYYQLDLLEKIQRLVKEDHLTALITLHDPNLLARFCDQVALIADGRLLSQGTPQAVLKPEILSQAYRVSFDMLTTEDHFPVLVPSYNGK